MSDVWWEDDRQPSVWTSPAPGETAWRAVLAARDAVRRLTTVRTLSPDPPDAPSGADAA